MIIDAFGAPPPTEDDRRRDAALAGARAQGALMTSLPDNLAPSSLQSSYATQTARMNRRGARMPAGFKLGGTNAASRRAYGCDTPYFGMLCADEIVNSGDADLAWTDRLAPRAEPEIAIAVTEDLPPRAEGYSLATLRASIAWAAVAIDFSDTALADPEAAGLAWMLADGCEAGRLVLGPRLGADALDGLEDAYCALIFDNVVISIGSGSALIGGALGALSEFLLVLAKLNVVLPAGVPVALGGCAPAIPVPKHAVVEARFGDTASATVSL